MLQSCDDNYYHLDNFHYLDDLDYIDNFDDAGNDDINDSAANHHDRTWFLDDYDNGPWNFDDDIDNSAWNLNHCEQLNVDYLAACIIHIV
ncbi:MAG: hypothetical protein ACKOAT_03260, partial [Actinomycetota bacterium]